MARVNCQPQTSKYLVFNIHVHVHVELNALPVAFLLLNLNMSLHLIKPCKKLIVRNEKISRVLMK